MYNIHNDQKYYISDIHRVNSLDKKLNVEQKDFKSANFFHDNLIDKEINNLRDSLNKKNNFISEYHHVERKFDSELLRRNRSLDAMGNITNLYSFSNASKKNNKTNNNINNNNIKSSLFHLSQTDDKKQINNSKTKNNNINRSTLPDIYTQRVNNSDLSSSVIYFLKKN